jgi:CRISPR/Cas system CSM-associated protein Csm2 small subunit
MKTQKKIAVKRGPVKGSKEWDELIAKSANNPQNQIDMRKSKAFFNSMNKTTKQLNKIYQSADDLGGGRKRLYKPIKANDTMKIYAQRRTRQKSSMGY